MSLQRFNLTKTVKSILSALVIALFIRYLFIQPFKIPSKSMYPNLLVGDHLLVDRINYGLGFPCSDSKIIKEFKSLYRGDVIVFRYPLDDGSIKCPNGGFIGLSSIYYIKRIIGLPGDRVTIKNKDIYVNGKKISYAANGKELIDGKNHDIYIDKFIDKKVKVIYDKQFDSFRDSIQDQEIDVPLGKYFVLGDNRDNSKDSRYWGFVPRENIIGKAVLIHFSWNNNFKNVKDIVRFERIFDKIE
jgi:signal peptidase I